MEKINRPVSGYLAFVVAILLLLGAAACIVVSANQENKSSLILAAILGIAFIFVSKGIMIVNPNHARVLTFFGNTWAA